ncbi:MAG: GIY-YIG nuclease family protein [Patescibacteria group bacterium]|nr:GIY-YIG nuclease family protein [Patescibacteria group bacterium]
MNGKEFSEYLHVPHGTVKRWLHEGMPAVRRVGGVSKPRQVQIDPVVAEAWVNARYPNSISVNRTSVVYFVRRGSDGAIKIGFTSDIERRLRELRAETADTIVLVAVFAGDKKKELRLHERFAPHRLSPDAEWFCPHSDILGFIDRLGSELDA